MLIKNIKIEEEILSKSLENQKIKENIKITQFSKKIKKKRGVIDPKQINKKKVTSPKIKKKIKQSFPPI